MSNIIYIIYIQYAWDCPICTYRNEPTDFDCAVCKTPRPLFLKKRDSGIPLNFTHSNQDSILPENLPPIHTPIADIASMSPKGQSTKSFPDIQENEVLKDDPKPKANIDEFVMVGNGDEYSGVQSESNTDEKKDDEAAPSSKPALSNKLSKEEEEKSSIKELIIKVTNGEEISSIKHTTLEDILLLCHDTFTDSQTMLTILLDRLCDKNMNDVNARIRGVKMCESWIRNYWESDFYSNESMMDIMDQFIDDLSDSSKESRTYHLTDSDIKLLTRIKTTFNQKSNSYEIEKKRETAKARSNKLLGDIDVPKKYDVMDASAETIAQQLTLMDFALFQSIAKREMCGQGWKKKDRDIRSPHLLKMIAQFNQISKWVQCVVLQQKNKKKRTKCIEKFIRIAVYLKDLRNFSACCAINFGLSANVVYRLKDAWNGVSKQEAKQYTEIQLIYKGKKNWELLRILHKNAHAPSILHTGLFLQDLLNTDEGNDDKKKDGTVNFTKLKKTYQLIEQISMYQSSSYFKIKTNPIMQSYLTKIWKKQEAYNEDKMYKISTIVKNKDAEGKDIDDNDLRLMDW